MTTGLWGCAFVIARLHASKRTSIPHTALLPCGVIWPAEQLNGTCGYSFEGLNEFVWQNSRVVWARSFHRLGCGPPKHAHTARPTRAVTFATLVHCHGVTFQRCHDHCVRFPTLLRLHTIVLVADWASLVAAGCSRPLQECLLHAHPDLQPHSRPQPQSRTNNCTLTTTSALTTTRSQTTTARTATFTFTLTSTRLVFASHDISPDPAVVGCAAQRCAIFVIVAQDGLFCGRSSGSGSSVDACEDCRSTRRVSIWRTQSLC
jgi:hypothetical protein